MHWQITLATLFCLLEWQANGMLKTSPQEGQPRVIQLSLQRRKIQDPVAYDRQRIVKRGGIVQTDLRNLVSSSSQA